MAKSDQLCPTTTQVAETDVATPICSGKSKSRASHTASTPLPTSATIVSSAQPFPMLRATFVPPMLPLPTSKMLMRFSLPNK